MFAENQKGTIVERSIDKRNLFFSTMVMVSVTNQLVLDPTYEEMLISNNLLTVTIYPDGSHHLEKSLAMRTFATTSSHNIVPLE